MSDLLDKARCEEEQEDPCGAIRLLLSPHNTELGDFSVRRVLPSRSMRQVGPWVFFDHTGPAEFAPGKGVDVRPHPHIGLCTVTYVFEGEFLHRDSLGSEQVIRSGEVNLMVAGRGIVHSERTPPDLRNAGHTLHALQLWLALPQEEEEEEPAFFHYPADQVPMAHMGGVSVRVIMGRAYGRMSPVRTYAQTLYVEAELTRNTPLQLPFAEERAIYVIQGSVTIDGVTVPQFNMAVLNPTARDLVAREDCRLAVIGGEKLKKRFIEWNFVATSQSRIDQAKEQWRQGRFPKVPGDEDEFIPLPG